MSVMRLHWYQMLFLFITYIVPMTLMSLCYTIMGKVLWGSRSIGEMTQRQLESIRSKRKVNGLKKFEHGWANSIELKEDYIEK
ncbi:hypothetical protein GWI33_010910 [Rhynchophorus ferrugineus]|uniref:Uncharacterized protein n=1 Tax=Rhynchophorus ferrugineus TaxID=354439 RepID=A0A834IDK5_RHYFE|nr:hypothetical protein GWI33_010910 [Rhynchophorus ferrugineus]